MHIDSNCVSGWQLDQYELGILSARERLTVERHLGSCKACQALLDKRQEDAEEVSTLPGFDALMAAGMARLEETSASTPKKSQPGDSAVETGWSWWRMWSMSGMSMAALAAMILVFLPEAPTPMPWPELKATPAQRGLVPKVPPPDRVGKAGKAVFAVVHFHKGTKYSQWTKPRELLQPGDLIQFAYQLPKATHAMICSINAKGEISVFFPLGGRRSTRLGAGAGTLPKNGSLELDDYIGQERLWMITSSKVIEFAALRRALLAAFVDAGRSLAQMTELKGPWDFQSLLIQKTHTRKAQPAPRRRIDPPVRRVP